MIPSMAQRDAEEPEEERTAPTAAENGESDSHVLKSLLEVAKSQQESLRILAESMKGIERGLGTLEKFTMAGALCIL